MKKIIVFGFPHCGTSILKSIIGHIDSVDEIYDECHVIKKISFKKYIICKFPFLLPVFFTKKYDGYIKIFIIRNPLWVFSSLNKRFNYEIPENHGMQRYTDTIKQFTYYEQNEKSNLYLIKYEDMFENDFENLKKIFNNIGFKYSNQIFDNTKYTNKIISDIKEIPTREPNNADHGNYRTYQINQPIENNNYIFKIDLTEDQKFGLLNDEYVNLVYPEVRRYLEK